MSFMAYKPIDVRANVAASSPKGSRLVLRPSLPRPSLHGISRGFKEVHPFELSEKQRRKTHIADSTNRRQTFCDPFFKSQESVSAPENSAKLQLVPPPLRAFVREDTFGPRPVTQSARLSLPVQQVSLQDYLMGKQLGQGAYATVRAATHLATGRVFAIKTYEKQKLLDPQRKKSVTREIRILSKLDHPNIVKLYLTIEDLRQLHLVLEFVPGISLSTYLKQKSDRRLEESEARRIFRQLLAGVDYCHSRNVTHRDLKLENVLLDDRNNVKIIDFGFATCFSHDKKFKVLCGTPSYMAPEIVSKKEFYGPPADVWALGVMLYTMLCGTLPFKGQNDRELYQRVQKGQYQIPQHVPAGAKAVLQAIFILVPEKRPTIQQLSCDSWVALQPERRQLSFCRPTALTGSESTLKPLLPKSLAPSTSIRAKNSEDAPGVFSSRVADGPLDASVADRLAECL